MISKVDERVIYVFIVIISLLIYVPYIKSFDNYHECRHYSTGDSFAYEKIVVSIINDFDLNMANNFEERLHLSGGFALSPEGVLVTKYSILFSITTVPFYLLFGAIGVMYYNLLLAIMLNVIIYAINRVFFNKSISLMTAFLFATGTIIMNYSYNYLGSLFSTVLIAAGVLYILRKKYYLAALILGFACFAAVSNIPWIGIMFLFVFWDYFKNKVDWAHKKSITEGVKVSFSIIIIFCISLVPLLYSNLLLYGNAFVTGYHKTITFDENYNMITLDYSSGFNQELLSGLYNLLFHPTLGVVEANPVIIIACIGVIMIRKMKNQLWAVMLLTIIAGQFLFYAKWDMWYATEFGNRFVMFSIVIFSPFVGNVLNELLLKLTANSK
ncbi:MAG: hypothetical protein COB15_04835 [Flavobacteriales bacterium]|nr:MAG: hypothetical protein COB15_04835 [Flavobacteriales bacterium]